MTHEELVEQAKEAIAEVFSDTTVEPQETRESLEFLRDELDVLLDTL